MHELYEEDFSSFIDRDDVFDELSEKITSNWNVDNIEWKTYERKIYEAIDKTMASYMKNGNSHIENWDMWEQDLYNNALETLGLFD